MIVNDVITILNDFAPLAYAEDFDNTGLLVGDAKAPVTGVLVTLDTLEAVVDEAIEKKCNLIVSFHPILFKGLKKITGATYVERVVQKAIRNDIAIFAIHTALDNHIQGVNAQISEQLGLQNTSILIPQKGTIKKLTTYAPIAETAIIKEALFKAGAGHIGNYSNCSFTTQGVGTYKGNQDSQPTVGKKETFQEEAEGQINVIFQKHLEAKILKVLFNVHSYEEVAYEVTTLENTNQHIGMGMVGNFPKSITEETFLKLLKNVFNTPTIRHSALRDQRVKKVAVLGGSGSFAIAQARASGADAYVTSDLKYHDFFQAENSILLADIGHYESEQYTKDLLHYFLTKKITNFAPALKEGNIVLSRINTNPVSYYS